MNQTKYQAEKIEDDEFVLRTICMDNAELSYARDTFSRINFTLRTKMAVLSLQRWNKNQTKYINVRRCVVISIKELEEILPKVYELCHNTFFKETNPFKYKRYELIQKIYARAKKGFERKEDKTKHIYDDFYEELRNEN